MARLPMWRGSFPPVPEPNGWAGKGQVQLVRVVMPAQAGIHKVTCFLFRMGSRLRGNDDAGGGRAQGRCITVVQMSVHGLFAGSAGRGLPLQGWPISEL